MMKSKSEYKLQLINKIKEIDEKNVIDEIYRLLDMDFDDSVYETSEDQKKAIDEARQQIKNGGILTEREANQEIDKWLKE